MQVSVQKILIHIAKYRGIWIVPAFPRLFIFIYLFFWWVEEVRTYSNLYQLAIKKGLSDKMYFRSCIPIYNDFLSFSISDFQDCYYPQTDFGCQEASSVYSRMSLKWTHMYGCGDKLDLNTTWYWSNNSTLKYDDLSTNLDIYIFYIFVMNRLLLVSMRLSANRGCPQFPALWPSLQYGNLLLQGQQASICYCLKPLSKGSSD